MPKVNIVARGRSRLRVPSTLGAVAAAVVALLLSVLGMPAPAQAGPVQAVAGPQVDAAVLVYACHSPQSAGAGSTYITSYGCSACGQASAQRNLDGTDIAGAYYCTYDPNAHRYDLHRGLNSEAVHCNLPTEAGPNSHYVGSVPSCINCVYWMAKARGTALTGKPEYYCTYNPSNGFYDEHY